MLKREGMTRVASLVVLVSILGVAVAGRAASPLGSYGDADVTGKITAGNGATERFDLRVSKLKLTRTKIKLKATDDDLDVQIKVTLQLRDRVENVDNQVVTVESGSLAIKDLRTGTPLAWDGQFNDATYKLKRKSNGTWRLKHKNKLAIQALVGHPLYHGGRVTGVKVKATR